MARQYPTLVRGEGVYLYDNTGKRYLDAVAGIAVVNIGHARGEVAEVMAQQAATLTYVQSFIFDNDQAHLLAERVGRLTPPGLRHSYFVSGGSEAVETAIKLARQYHVENGEPRRYKIIARWQSYHGGTLGALSASGHSARRDKFAPLLLDFPHIPPANCYRCAFGQTYPGCGIECAWELERAVRQAGPENCSAFIAEPIVGAAGGAMTPPPEYFPVIRQICDKYGLLFISDEVITGFGRTGKAFGIDHWNVVPDMITSAKGLSGGYVPLGATIVHDRVRDVLEKKKAFFIHGYTYVGNPLAAAIGVIVLDIIERDGLIARVAKMGETFFAKGRKLLKHRIVGDVRGKGLLMGIELVKDKATKEPFPPAMRVNGRLAQIALDKGLVIYPGGGCVDGIYGDHFLLCPPFTITESEMDEAFGLLEESLMEMEKHL